MNRIWTLVCLEVVCFAVSGLTQDPSNTTLFLISGPEELRAGTPTPLAVTVFSDFPGRLMAEVAHGETKVSQTENFQGGLTSVLTLPPISGSILHNSLFNLTVSGYRGDSLIFTNTTTLKFNLRNVSSFIQTSRSRYKPGDTVKTRVVSVQLDNYPYTGRVEISVRDPSGNVVDRWESTGNPGIVLQEFSLSQKPPLGRWTVATTVNGVTDEKAFIVEHYEHPYFEVLVKTPSQVLIGDDISGSVRALYLSGQPVHGTLTVSVVLQHAINNPPSPLLLTQTNQTYGSTQFFFSADQLQALHTLSASSSGDHVVVHVAVCVNDSSTGLKVNKTVEVHLMQSKFQITFHHFPPTLKPSLHFSTNLTISQNDRKRLSMLDLMHPAVVEVTQRTSVMNEEPTTLALSVPEDGNVHIKFKLQDQVEMLFIRARFRSSEETLTVYTNYSSPSGSYIQILPVSTLPAWVRWPLQLNVESTFQPTQLHFVVSSNGQVVAAGTRSSSSFSLTPAPSWYPEACITVYCILSDGEVTSDTAHIRIHQYNQVLLNWSSTRAPPGEQVSLTVVSAESSYPVGIVVFGMHDDAPQAEPEFKAERECNLRMLTNVGSYEKKKLDGPKNEEDILPVQKYWSHWMDTSEPLLWLDANVSNMTWTSGKITVPNGVTSLGALAVVMSENSGLGFTPVPSELTVSKGFSLSLAVPPYLIRGEEIVLEVNIVSHLGQDVDVIVLLVQSEAFEFVLTGRRDALVLNGQKLFLGSHASASALFPIRPLTLGEMEIAVDAVSADASDNLVRSIMVKPEGVEQSSSQTLFLELEPEMYNYSRSVSFSFPPDVVPGSQRAQVALVGDSLALSINNLDSLVQLPLGCGEQNMIHFVPSVYVLQYLEISDQDNKEISSRALGYMMEGYHKQLSYQREDGSFSAFGDSDHSGSTWLTAFVLRSFLQARTFMQIDRSVLVRAMTWLLKQQGPGGEFPEVGRVIHTEMQGGLDDGPVALTAYVLVALLEDRDLAVNWWNGMYPDNVSLAQTYLENRVSSSVISNYSLCLVAYALTLANSPVAGTALAELRRRADYRDGVMMWRSSAGLRSHDRQPHSAQIEMASYVLLVLIRRGDFINAFELMKWLSMQRNHLGGYGTTQDTILALQVLSFFSAFSGAKAINLRMNISSPTSSFESQFPINSTNYQMYQSQEINANKDLHLNIYIEGKGFATFQLNVFYNLESKTFPPNLQLDEEEEEEAFSLNVKTTDEDDHNHMMLSICTRLKDNQVIPQTGMVIVDVGMLSGFSLSLGAAAPPDFIRKMDTTPEKIILYLDALTKSEVCITLPLMRVYRVAHVQDAVVQVYDYYEPTRKATSTYNSDVLHNLDSCFFCGVDCDDCWPGITITMSSPFTSHSISSATYSLSCLFLGVAALLIIL